MFQAIQTTYHGPTNMRGSRVSARAEAGRVTLEWDDAYDGVTGTVAPSVTNCTLIVTALSHCVLAVGTSE